MGRFPSTAAYAGVTVALLALLALTTATAYVNLGPCNLPLALGIAAAKALLVFLFFMHLWHGRASFRIAALLGFFMLGLAGALTMSDYLARNRYEERVRPVLESEVPLARGFPARSRGRPVQHPPPPVEREPKKN